MTEPRFDSERLAWLRDVHELHIETRAADETVHRTIIWVVVDQLDRAFIRSYRGSRARWYREALAQGGVRLLGGGRSVPVTLESATDPERMDACSAELERKYADDPATPAMVRADVLDTTLQLHPA